MTPLGISTTKSARADASTLAGPLPRRRWRSGASCRSGWSRIHYNAAARHTVCHRRDRAGLHLRRNHMWTRLLASALLILAVAATATAQPTSLQIFRSVQRQVLTYPQFTVFDSVNAQIGDGVVTLTGKVTTPLKRKEIEERVRRVQGLKGVNNQIEVLPASRSDDQLRQQIANAIYGHAAFSNYATQVNPPIHIIVERGRVTLEGVVANNLDRQLAYTLASQFQSFSVKNALRTEDEVKKELEML
jgi:hyperosmotically inducible protein